MIHFVVNITCRAFLEKWELAFPSHLKTHTERFYWGNIPQRLSKARTQRHLDKIWIKSSRVWHCVAHLLHQLCWSLLLTFERILDSWVKRTVAWEKRGREDIVRAQWLECSMLILASGVRVLVPKENVFIFFSNITLVYSTIILYLRVSLNITIKVYPIYFLCARNKTCSFPISLLHIFRYIP